MRIKPFKAIRPESCEVDKIASLPYDTLEEEEARKLAEGNEKSFLRIERAEVDLPEYATVDEAQILVKAKNNLQEFLSNGWLVQDDKSSYYLYRLRKDGRALYGIVLTVAVEDYANGQILPHEQTLPNQESERFSLDSACDAHTSPVTLGYRQRANLEELLSQYRSRRLPLYTFDSFYDVEHCIWRVNDKRLIEAITETFADDIEQMYILEGHHRMEAAAQLAERRLEDSETVEAEDQYILAVAFPMEQVELSTYHRLVRGRLQAPEWRKIRENFLVTEVDEFGFQPAHPGTIGMYDGETFYRLTAKEHLLHGGEECLAVSLLQDWILQPVFGIAKALSDRRLSFFGGDQGVETMLERSRERSSIAFVLCPPTKEQLVAAAESGEVMPPKTTWLEPKVLSGIFLHALETKVATAVEKELTL